MKLIYKRVESSENESDSTHAYTLVEKALHRLSGDGLRFQSFPLQSYFVKLAVVHSLRRGVRHRSPFLDADVAPMK